LRLLCLDLSTNSGWALLVDEKLSIYGNIRHKVEGDHESLNYPMNYIDMACAVAWDVYQLAIKHNPDFIIIEETNKGKNRYSQKQLEFIHFAVNARLNHENFKEVVKYIDTSEWRKLLGLSLDKEQRQSNNEVKRQRGEVKRELENQYDRDHTQVYSIACAHIKKLERRRAIKAYMLEREKWVKEKLRPFRSKIDGKVAGKIGVKNLSVDFVNEMFSLKLKKKDNDIADAICLGVAYQKKDQAIISKNSNIVHGGNHGY
jgi:Holliday junction resolvasome RuvABC endonuclease subunit